MVVQHRMGLGDTMNWLRHLGSRIAFAFGCPNLVAGVTHPSSTLTAGAALVLGSLAYRSAKKRRLGEVKSTPARQVGEIILVLLIVPIVALQNDLKYSIATDPVPSAI